MVQYRGIFADPKAVEGATSSGDAGGAGGARPAAPGGRGGGAGPGGLGPPPPPAPPAAPVLVNGRRPEIEVLHLSPGGRGLEQIADHLAGLHGISILHLLCHGEPGVLVLAGDRIDLPALAVRRALLADMGPAFGCGARVALYGCSVAAGAAGLQFLDYLEAALGVGVAASAGPVGAAALGGRWVLRDRYGATVETAFTPLSRATYPALLTATH